MRTGAINISKPSLVSEVPRIGLNKGAELNADGTKCFGLTLSEVASDVRERALL